MSRIGKKPVPVPAGVTANLEGQTLSVKGPKGTLSMTMLDELVRTSVEDGQISVQPVNDSQRSRAAWGMQRTNVLNLVTGVTEGFTKVLEITGVGYRAAAQGKNLRLQLGYSHDVNYAIPEGIDVKTPDPNTVEISGIDKQKVGQVAAEIRRWRKPEPYKGKGIKYRGEFIFRKEGKKK
ncbi:50S ribosomal protein L6 [Sphingomonas sp. LHG3443-2]|uniref:50S ribosomal protein L6 n=1 Tax=Sphingomonas sp. LHG3443-2 TaxID=2804639 RepID=UPI003CF34BF9